MTIVSPISYIWGENKNWAISNKNSGRSALICGACATTIGTAKSLLDEDSFSHKALNLIQSFFKGIRSYKQYNIYSREEDDDLGEDKVLRPSAHKIGKVACGIEKYINPGLIPISGLLNKNYSDGIDSLSHFINSLWWRTRLFSKKNSFELLNKDLLIGIYNNYKIGNISKELAINGSQEILKPVLGLAGLIFTGIFTPIKSIKKFFGTENRIINSCSAFGNATQSTYYLLKFTIPEYYKIKRAEEGSSKTLFGLGIIGNLLVIFSPIEELFKFKNETLEKLQNIYRELSVGCTLMFFSLRRHILGKQWLLENEAENSNKAIDAGQENGSERLELIEEK